jgi:hypothetical protein
MLVTCSANEVQPPPSTSSRYREPLRPQRTEVAEMSETAASSGTHKLLLSLHITAAVGALGADLGLVALGIAGLAGTPAAALYPAASIMATYVLTPLALLALLSGVTLALTTRYGLFRHWWVLTKLGIALLLSVAVLFVLVPSLGELAAASAAGTVPSGRPLLLALAPGAATSLLLLAVLLGVFKPGRRAKAG